MHECPRGNVDKDTLDVAMMGWDVRMLAKSWQNPARHAPTMAEQNAPQALSDIFEGSLGSVVGML